MSYAHDNGSRFQHFLGQSNKTPNPNHVIVSWKYTTSHSGFLSPQQTHHLNRAFVRLVGLSGARYLAVGCNAFLVGASCVPVKNLSALMHTGQQSRR